MKLLRIRSLVYDHVKREAVIVLTLHSGILRNSEDNCLAFLRLGTS